MARLPRLSVSGLPHLVEHSGHNRQPVFLGDEDRAVMRGFLREALSECAVAVHAYCFDVTRLLLLATPRQAEGLSRMMQRVARRYTAWFNQRHGRSGTIWSGRFRATVVDPDTEVVAAMRHIEADAMLAGDAVAAEERRISSAAHHLGVANDALVSDHERFWALGNTPFERHAAYRRLLEQPLGALERRRFDDAVRKGWALGPEAFLLQLGAQAARRVAPLPPGRPRKRPE